MGFYLTLFRPFRVLFIVNFAGSPFLKDGRRRSSPATPHFPCCFSVFDASISSHFRSPTRFGSILFTSGSSRSRFHPLFYRLFDRAFGRSSTFTSRLPTIRSLVLGRSCSWLRSFPNRVLICTHLHSTSPPSGTSSTSRTPKLVASRLRRFQALSTRSSCFDEVSCFPSYVFNALD